MRSTVKPLLKYKGIIELVISFILAFSIIVAYFHETTNFENLALGVYTRAYYGKINNVPMHSMGLRKKEEILKGNKERGAKDVVLLIGNSQTHSINQYKEGDVTFPELLADSLDKKSIDIIASSVPNATMEDFYLLYQSWKKDVNIKMVVFPIFLDDTREEGIQQGFYNDIKSFRIADSNAIAKKINGELEKMEKVTGTNDLAALNQTFQEITESKLDNYLNTHFNPWFYRPNIRGEFFSNLYKLRNTVLGIDAKTKRGIIKDIYEENIKALKMLLDDCRKSNIKVLVYIPPLRNDYEIPYYRNEYITFKKQMGEITKEYNAGFINIENCVPNKYWGFKGTRTFKGLLDIDFMHFQYPGHIIMADTLQTEIEKMIK